MSDLDEAFVYVIAKQLHDSWGLPCKIGLARNPHRRLLAIATCTPFPVALYGLIGPLPRSQANDLEQHFHRWMKRKDARIGGIYLCGEWYNIDAESALNDLHLSLFMSHDESDVDYGDDICEHPAYKFARTHTTRLADAS